MRRGEVIALAFLALAAPAAAEDARWTLRGRGIRADYSRHSAFATPSVTSTLDLEGGTGAEAALELRPTPRVGLELSLGRLTLDADSRVFTQRGDFSTTPPTVTTVLVGRSESELVVQPLALAVLFHPGRGGRLDWYLGPQLAWNRYDVDRASLGPRDPELAWGAKAGAELPLGASGWAAGLELRYAEAFYEEQERDHYSNLGMASAALGVSYRFPR